MSSINLFDVFNSLGSMGLLIAAVVYFSQRDKRQQALSEAREAALGQRLSSLEEWCRTELSGLLSRAMSSLDRNTEIHERVERHLERMESHR